MSIERFLNKLNDEKIAMESILISKPDVSYSLDKWLSGEDNILFVFGLLGSGKSTKGKELAKLYDAHYLELDVVDRGFKKQYGKDVFRASKNPEFVAGEYRKYIDNEAKTKKLVIEGGQLIHMEFDFVKQHPIYFVNTSLITSSWRAMLREFKKEHIERFKKIDPLSVPKKNLRIYSKFEDFKKAIIEYNSN